MGLRGRGERGAGTPVTAAAPGRGTRPQGRAQPQAASPTPIPGWVCSCHGTAPSSRSPPSPYRTRIPWALNIFCLRVTLSGFFFYLKNK